MATPTAAPTLYLPVAPPASAPPLHGLRASGREIPSIDGDRWEAGVEFYPESCATVRAWSPECSGAPVNVGSNQPLTGPDAPTPLVVQPGFTLYTSFVCDAQGEPLRDDLGRVQMQLEVGTSKGMEAQFWGNPIGLQNGFDLVHDTPNVQGNYTGTLGILNATATTAPVTVTPRVGLAALGRALGSCGLGGIGMVHVTPDVGEILVGNGHIREDGDRLVTVTRGDVVVVGSGYPGTGPAGNPKAAPDPGTVWMYGTGIVEYRLGTPRAVASDAAERLFRPQDRFESWMQRSVQMQVDGCCAYAVLVQIAADA